MAKNLKRNLSIMIVTGEILFAILSLAWAPSILNADGGSDSCDSSAKRNGYFDGRLLTGSDLKSEQVYTIADAEISTRNNYFDGKLLSAEDFRSEQTYSKEDNYVIAYSDC